MKKDLIITALLTFCLAAVLFTAIPTRSQETLEYDPWKDINDDGKLDILDLVQISSEYGAEGDPTKNVNVTNWPFSWNFTVSNQKTTKITVVEVNKTIHVQRPPDDLVLVCSFNTDGFSQIHIFFKIIPTIGQPNTCDDLRISLRPSAWNITGDDVGGSVIISAYNPIQTSIHHKEWCSPNAELYANIYNIGTTEGWFDFTVVAYLMA